MACDSLLTTSLLQVVNRLQLVQVDYQKLLSKQWPQIVSTSGNKFANDKLKQAQF